MRTASFMVLSKSIAVVKRELRAMGVSTETNRERKGGGRLINWCCVALHKSTECDVTFRNRTQTIWH